MSSTIFLEIDGEKTDISVTAYAGPGGAKYQVTWRSSDKEKLFDYVSFTTWALAKEFAEALNRRVKND